MDFASSFGYSFAVSTLAAGWFDIAAWAKQCGLRVHWKMGGRPCFFFFFFLTLDGHCFTKQERMMIKYDKVPLLGDGGLLLLIC